MNRRINYGRNTPLTFRESLQFDRDCPYQLRCKDFVNDDIAPPHYAETMEIEVCCGITGEVVIENERIRVEGDTVVVVPPGAVHAVTFRSGPGQVYVLHISFADLRPFVDVEAMLAREGRSLTDAARICPDFGEICQLVQELIARDGDPFARVRLLLEILEHIFARRQAETPAGHLPPAPDSDELRRILRWTEEHFTGEICLEDAARAVGFSKNYFCTWFKGRTGLTYMGYLSRVRISNACRLLAQTGSIASACYGSGFQDMSYFIQLFKRTQGVTPKTYLRNLSE